MTPSVPIQIVGGGLAGLTLGLLLRERQIPVTLWEAGSYPRHRVCGEFLSGHGQRVLDSLGLLPMCEGTGAQWARTALFANERRTSAPRPLPQPALCLSRHALDALLARAFSERGGELKTRQRRDSIPAEPGWIQATGRQPQAQVGGWRWFGFKAHAENVVLDADLELHVSQNSYVGLCRIEGGRVNVCGLFRRHVGEAPSTDRTAESALRGVPGSPLHRRLSTATLVSESVCAVAGLDLRPRSLQNETRWLLGDAAGMIPPFTGNGMSLALESAEWSVEPLTRFASGRCSWEQARRDYAAHSGFRTRRRLRWAGVLQRLLFLPAAPALLLTLSRPEPVWRRLFALTRGD